MNIKTQHEWKLLQKRKEKEGTVFLMPQRSFRSKEGRGTTARRWKRRILEIQRREGEHRWGDHLSSDRTEKKNQQVNRTQIKALESPDPQATDAKDSDVIFPVGAEVAQSKKRKKTADSMDGEEERNPVEQLNHSTDKGRGRGGKEGGEKGMGMATPTFTDVAGSQALTDLKIRGKSTNNYKNNFVVAISN
jgi:hypothetical protein